MKTAKTILLLSLFSTFTHTAQEETATEKLAALIASLPKRPVPQKEIFYRPKGTNQWLPVPPDYLLRHDTTKYDYAKVIHRISQSTRRVSQREDTTTQKQRIKLLVQAHKSSISIQIFLSGQFPGNFNRIKA